MSDDPVLAMIEAMRAELATLSHDVRDIRERQTEMKAVLASHATAMARIGLEIDRVENRLARIERRLDVVSSTV